MERLKIVITGASGFLGANLTQYFNKNHEVYALAREKDSWRLGEYYNVVKFDIRKLSNVFSVIDMIKPDVVLHCATYGAYHFQKDKVQIIETNVVGSLNLIKATKRVPIIINVGSSSEYGNKQTPMKETDIPAPTDDYAMSKAMQTDLFRSMQNAVTLRLFSVYGYYEEKHRLIPYLIYSLIKNERAVLSNRRNLRDFIFVEDVMRAFSLTIEKYQEIEKGSVFNVGSGNQKTVEDVVNELKVDVEWNPTVRAEEPDRMWQADVSEIKEKLGWTPQNTLFDGLEKTKSWMAMNLRLYEEVKNDKLARLKQDSKRT